MSDQESSVAVEATVTDSAAVAVISGPSTAIEAAATSTTQQQVTSPSRRVVRIQRDPYQARTRVWPD